MIRYPIQLNRQNDRGSDVKKQQEIDRTNEIISIIEDGVNDMLLKQTSPIQSYTYVDISSATGLSLEVAKQYVFYIDGGSNGFTAIRHDLSYEEALDAEKNVLSD